MTFFIAGPLAVAAIVLGLAGRGRARREVATNRKTATAGLVTGLVAATLSVIGFVTVINAVDDAATDLNEAFDDVETSEDSGDEPVTSSDNTANPPTADVTVDACEVDEFGFVTVPLTVTNHSSEASSYFITIEVTDANDVRVGEALGSVDTLRPEQTAQVDAAGFDDLSGAGAVTCTLLRVERFSADG